MGGQRLQRGDAADPAGLRRSRTHGDLVRADVLDVSRVRPRRDDHLGRRPPPRGLQLRPRRGQATRRGAPAERDPAALAEQPDRHRAAARRDRRAVRTGGRGNGRRRGGHRRGVRRVPPRRHPLRPRAARRAPQPARHPHDEQGVRAGRGPAGLPRRRSGDLRRPARRTPALPPLGGHPGGRERRPQARRRAARQGRGAARGAGPDGGVAGREGIRGRAERRELRIVRSVRRSSGTLAAAPGPRGADPGDRARGLAAGLDRHGSRDDGVQGRPGARTDKEEEP